MVQIFQARVLVLSLSMKGYGISAIHESWLRPRIEALGRLEITKVMPAQWDNHQDVWCIRKL